MVTFAKVFAIAITIVIASHAAYAVRILPVSDNTGNAIALPIDYNDTTNVEHHSRPHARKLYVDGEGTYVGSDSVDRSSGEKCWTDYFAVSHSLGYDNWEKASGNIFCTDTSSCQVSHMAGHQTCETTTIKAEAGIQAEIFSLGVSYSHDLQKCSVGQDTSMCNWDDQDCHCIWTRQQLLNQYGYARRRCTSPDGDQTQWMQEWIHSAPTSVIDYGCGSKCTD